MNDTTLRQWRLFLAVADSGSVAAAARQVALTQPAVSQALAQLEDRLGERLFDRVGRGLHLNAAGRRLRPEARALLEQAARCERLFETPELEVELSATHTLGNYYLPPLLADFRARHPAARVRLDVVNTRTAVARLLALETELALVEGPVSHRLLAVRRWRDDTLVRVAAPSLAAVLGPDPASWPWVMREPGSGTRAVIEARLGEAFPPAERLLQLGAGEAVRQALLAGAGVGYVSLIAAARALEDGRLARVPGAGAELRRPLYLLRHRRRSPGEGERALETLLLEGAAQGSSP
ncbi:LysR substrate-binding domain-containing protein [Alloalcanivorax sp. C16-2]|uniref:LysR substrate-binding domain-containing protein n=1 Tax=Alloalcanivorax TaxID=3020832 RepID=UPI00193139C7|nr:LysR substrate-binding domain-containing protein [Alloalcanivorax marinus]MBL7251615.1 LysR family transcriptional regulator [Alloalcanivorax marinus]